MAAPLAATYVPGTQGVQLEAPMEARVRLPPPAVPSAAVLGTRRMVSYNIQDPEIKRKISELIAEHSPTDGKLYREIRNTVQVDEEEMQEHIKISIGYIRALEENRFDLLPQPVYVKGFLRSYLKYLGIPDHDRLVQAYAESFTTWHDKKESNT